jgi:voltage-gated potassium channel
MLNLTLIGILLVCATVTVHALGTGSWFRFFMRNRGYFGHGRHLLKVLVFTSVFFLLLHLVEIMLWAITYRQLVTPDELASLEQAFYFSIVTFTTLGYGDITLSEQWRILSGVEAINGILLIGWSTALLFAVVQNAIKRAVGEEQNS